MTSARHQTAPEREAVQRAIACGRLLIEMKQKAGERDAARQRAEAMAPPPA